MAQLCENSQCYRFLVSILTNSDQIKTAGTRMLEQIEICFELWNNKNTEWNIT